AERDEL
nr:Chain B, ALA-GLU-ARG-ASP-GLU-LEU [Homo sapiens]